MTKGKKRHGGRGQRPPGGMLVDCPACGKRGYQQTLACSLCGKPCRMIQGQGPRLRPDETAAQANRHLAAIAAPPAVPPAAAALPRAVTSLNARRELCSPYAPTGLPRAAALISEARRRFCRPDGLPHDWGWQPPSETPPDCWIRLVLSALFVGLEEEDWGRVAEAAGMLQDAERFLRPPAEEGDDDHG